VVWVKAREEALDPLTPHEARHCAASYLIEAGLNDLELTATIGHSDSRTTKRIYGHLFPDSGATIAAKLDAYLDAPAAWGAAQRRVCSSACRIRMSRR
jgi:integrase